MKHRGFASVFVLLSLMLGCTAAPPAVDNKQVSAAPGESRAMAMRARAQIEIDRTLRRQPLMDAIARRYPADWHLLVSALEKTARDGNDAAQTNNLIRRFRKKIAPRLRHLTSLMPDSLLADFFDLKAQTYDWHAAHQPRRCAKALAGGAAGRREMQQLFRLLPERLRRRHVAMMVRIVSSAPPHSSDVRPARDQRYDEPPGMDSSVQPPVQARSLPTMARREATDRGSDGVVPLSACAAMAKRLRAIRQMPSEAAVVAYRRLLPRALPHRYRVPAYIVSGGAGPVAQLIGRLGLGSAERLRMTLKAHPQVDTIALSSDGGLLSEGFAIAAVIARHGLDTRVDNNCVSACTVAFLAGKERWSHPGAMIGFHSPSSAGYAGEPTHLYQSISDFRRLYPHPAISNRFLIRVAKTPAVEVWYPTWETLRANGIVTRQTASQLPATEKRANGTRHGPLAGHGKGWLSPGTLAVPATGPMPTMSSGAPAVGGVTQLAPVAAFAEMYPEEWQEELTRYESLYPHGVARWQDFVWSRVFARYRSVRVEVDENVVGRGINIVRKRLQAAVRNGPAVRCDFELIPDSGNANDVARRAAALPHDHLSMMARVLRGQPRRQSTPPDAASIRRAWRWLKGTMTEAQWRDAWNRSPVENHNDRLRQCSARLTLLNHLIAKPDSKPQRLLRRDIWARYF